MTAPGYQLARARERVQLRRDTAAAMAQRYRWAAINLQARGFKRSAKVCRAAAGEWEAKAKGRRP